MSDPRMTASAVGQQEPTHHGTRAGFDVPVTCGKADTPKPFRTTWDGVTCPACLERRCEHLVEGRAGARCIGIKGERHVHRAQWYTMDGR